MSKKYILKDIEQLKQANTFLETLFADIRKYKNERGTSYPTGIPNFRPSDEFQINYNGMCIDILEYFVEKLGDKEELNLGKYLTCNLNMLDTRIRIVFSLNDEVSSKLYEVFGSWSAIYEWSEKHILPLLTLITSRYLDFETVLAFFENIAIDTSWDKEKHLSFDSLTYTKSRTKAKEIIDDIFKLSENEEVLKDVDEVLDVYFDKVFKYNKEEDWY